MPVVLVREVVDGRKEQTRDEGVRERERERERREGRVVGGGLDG